MGELVQRVVHERDELIERLRVAVVPGEQQLRNLTWRLLVHRGH
jgi:hypothetical protein